MYQYDDSTASSTLPTPAAAGAAGFFTDGSAALGQAPTVLRSDFMNMLMLELLNVVTAAGLTPSKTTYNQVLTAIQQLSVSAVEQALAYKIPVAVATTGSNIALSGLQTIDGVALTAGQRVLVKDQTNQAQNGIYVAAAGTWVLAFDDNAAADMVIGMLVPVQTGTANAMTTWQLKATAPVVLGTSALTFIEVGANVAQFAILSQIQAAIQENLYSSAQAAGTSDAITASFTPAITTTTMASGVVEVTIRATAANTTTTPTFTPNSGVIAPAVIVKGSNQALSPGDIAGAGHWVTLQLDATLGKWVLLNPANGVAAQPQQLQNFNAAVASNALTGTFTPSGAPIQFRNPTLGTGTPVSVTPSSALSLTIPSGATLGATSGQQSQFVWALAYNGGAPILAVANFTYGMDLSETGLISPVAISSSANQANTWYAASAVSNTPFKIVGVSQQTEATAGTYATAPSLVQPVGGEAFASLGKMQVLSVSAVTTSGASLLFSSIPSNAKRITIAFNGVSTSGSSATLIQLGSGSVQSSGYTAASTSVSVGTGSSTSYTTSSAGFPVFRSAASNPFSGSITLVNVGGNIWVASGLGYGGSASSQTAQTGGVVTLSGAIDRINLVAVNGTDTFSAGSVNMIIEA